MPPSSDSTIAAQVSNLMREASTRLSKERERVAAGRAKENSQNGVEEVVTKERPGVRLSRMIEEATSSVYKSSQERQKRLEENPPRPGLEWPERPHLGVKFANYLEEATGNLYDANQERQQKLVDPSYQKKLTEAVKPKPKIHPPCDNEAFVPNNESFVLSSFSKFDKTAPELREACKKCDWKAVRDYFEPLRGDSMQRSHCIKVAVSVMSETWEAIVNGNFIGWLDQWLAEEPSNVDCRLLRAEALLKWAESTQDDDEARFQRFNIAASEISHLLTMAPEESLSYAAVISLARLRGEKKSMAVVQVFPALTESNNPLDYTVYFRAFFYYHPDRCGSCKELRDFVTSLNSRLPTGHLLWILTPMMYYVVFKARKDADALWLQTKVTILSAYESFCAAESVKAQPESLEFNRAVDLVTFMGRNWFAYALTRVELAEEARREMMLIGKQPLRNQPWRTVEAYKDFVIAVGFAVDTDQVRGEHSD